MARDDFDTLMDKQARRWEAHQAALTEALTAELAGDRRKAQAARDRARKIKKPLHRGADELYSMTFPGGRRPTRERRHVKFLW